MQIPAELSPAIRNYLGEFVMRWRRLILLRAVGSALFVLVIWISLACAADRLFQMPGPIRLWSLVGAGLAAIAVGVLRLGRIRGQVNWVEMARTIEVYDPSFHQSLITVTSRLLGSPEHRGSDDILSHLLRDVERCAAERTARKLLTLRFAAVPWLALAGVVIIFSAITCIPGTNARQLLARTIEPMADIPPVTTTSLAVAPGNADVMQSEPFRVEASVLHLGNGSVQLSINNDGTNWAHYSMDNAGAGRFAYTINSIGHDLAYKVAAGDAVAGPYTVRVKRPPAVAEYRIHYTYPTYTRRAPADVVNSDGTIEAPVGADATLSILATEPLQSALLTVGDQKVLMNHVSPDNAKARQATLHITADASYELDLISTREVRGGGGKLHIRAAVDHPPLVRLYQAGQTLRLNPRDILPLAWQAMDDYGLDDVAVIADINGDTPARIPLRLAGDRHRQDQTVNLDLGSLHFKTGDVLSLMIAAKDTARQETRSDELLVLIVPRSIDLNAHERIEQLQSARGLAGSLADEFDAAAKANEELANQKDHQAASYLTAEAHVARHLSSASEAATLLRQALLRAAAHSDTPELSTAIAGWIDAAYLEFQTADELFRGDDSMGAESRDRIRHAVEISRQLSSELETVVTGQKATALLADRLDLKSSRNAHSSGDAKLPENLAKILTVIGDEINSRASEIGVNTAAADADTQLQNRIDAATGLARSKQPIDFAATARQWSQDLQKDSHRHSGLQTRLVIAADAEAVRPDADLQAARDLELASRAAGAIETSVNRTPQGKPVQPGQLNGFATSLEALQRLHLTMRQAKGSHSTDEIRLATNVANRAREELSHWATENKEPKTATPHPADLESLALRAGADAAGHDYKHASEADHALVQKLSDVARNPGGKPAVGELTTATSQMVDQRIDHIQQTAEQVARQMSTAETVDRLGQTEEKLLAEARGAKVAPHDLAGRQQAVAEQIAKVEREQDATAFPSATTAGDTEDQNWRGRATAALLLAQEELAAMPRELALVQESDKSKRKASDRAAEARRQANSADPEQKLMATRAAEQAEQDARDAAVQLGQSLGAVLPAVASDLADRLDPFAPEASAARDLVSGPLAKSLTDLEAGCHDGNADAVSHAAGDALKAIDGIQQELKLAQDQFTARDPLLAAKWFARAATDSLTHHPGDIRTALGHQANVSLALSRAWDHSIHKAAELRLAELPSLQSVYTPLAPDTSEIAAAALAPSAGSRDWGHLHARDNDNLTATMQDPDPPGYEEPLRLYFEALGKAQEKPK